MKNDQTYNLYSVWLLYVEMNSAMLYIFTFCVEEIY
jgi:hypothetical protein